MKRIALLLVVLVVINILASFVHARIDLTKEKRYTLSRASKTILRKLDSDVDIDVFLKGEFPAQFRKLTNSVEEFLQLLKESNSSRVKYHFISPLDEVPGKPGTKYGDSLMNMGATPINLKAQVKTGESSSLAYPYAIMKYKGREELITLFTAPPAIGNGETPEKVINSAEALLEYQFVKALDRLTNYKRPGIGYSVGNGEPVDHRTYDLRLVLSNDYELRTVNLNTGTHVPDSVNLLLIVKPTLAFSEEEKLKIDQFVMRGGKLLCFIDNLIAERDSLAFKPETIAYDRNLNLTDLFFRYGLRINTDLVMDLQCDVIPFVIGGSTQNPQIEFLHWNYYPLLMSSDKPIKVPGYVTGQFVNSIDSIAVPGVVKTPLLVTSANSRIISTPALISLNENKNTPEDEKFKRDAIPAAMLLEGTFTSLFRNRLSKAQSDTLAAAGENFQSNSVPNKMIVVADGDIVLNDYVPSNGPNAAPEPLPMGWNKYTYTEYLKESQNGQLFIPAANRDFLLNCIEYLVSSPAIAETRNKEIVLRMLDPVKVKQQKSTWQMINIAAPILLVILAGWFYQEYRKKVYSQ